MISPQLAKWRQAASTNCCLLVNQGMLEGGKNDHVPAKEMDCFVKLKECVEKLLVVVRNERLKVD